MENRYKDRYIDGKITFSKEVEEKFKNSGYGLVGHHSGIEICSWTKKDLRDEGHCYKKKFYGIDTHRCAQITPALAWCQENCVFCWRPMEWMKTIKMNREEVDDPKEIIKGVVEQRKKLLSGFGGNEKVNKEKFKEAMLFPSHWAISLSGEPTIYPLLAELVLELRKHKEVRSIFIVSNGQEPERFLEMKQKNALPTQLYISVDASNKEMFKRINRSVYKDGWERLNRTLSILPELNCRRVIRYTLIKGLNDKEEDIPEFAKLFEKSKADFIEIKAYMFLGMSRERLKVSNMPLHKDVKEYAQKLLKYLDNYEYNDEHEPSRIVLLKRKDSKYKNYIEKAIAE